MKIIEYKFINILLIFTISIKEKEFIKNKILEHGGKILNLLYLLVQNYYHLFYILMLLLQMY
jgi:hypothetical protein